MRKLNQTLKLFAIGASLLCASAVSAQTLTTSLAGDNENDGVMFDIATGANALSLTSLGANIIGTADYQVYFRTGSINQTISTTMAGNFSDPAAWTLVSSFSNVVGIGTLSSQPGGIVTFDIADLALAANTTYGLYITQTTNNFGLGSGVRFTNSIIGSVVASDANLTILNSRGASYPFNGVSRNGRNFNGSLTYTITAAVPEPATWLLMIVGFGLTGAALRRRGAVAATS